MRRGPHALVALVLLGAAQLGAGAGCAGMVLPPARTEVGSTVIAAGGQPTTGVRFSTGAHLASGSLSTSLPIDVGAGYVYEHAGSDAPGRSDLALGAGGDSAPTADGVNSQGAYLSAQHLLSHGGGSRSWLGLRGELLVQDGSDGRHTALGSYARIDWELIAPGKGEGGYTDNCGGGAGVAYGVFGVGLYLESGVRWVESERSAFVTTAGLTLRTPFLAGLVLDTCSVLHC